MSYLQSLTEDRRLWLLKLLKRSGNMANESVLLTAIQSAGHRRVTRDQIREDMTWLGDRGLVTLSWPDEALAVATLTRRGGDVADGNVDVEGVKQPDPFEQD